MSHETDRPPNIVNVADVEAHPYPAQFAPKGAAAERYGAKMAFVGRQVGAVKLGYNVTTVAPGKRAFPAHNHRINEEMFFILSGTGEVRIGAATYPIREGDFIGCPPGDRATAHQIVNTGREDLRFLAVSTKESLDIAEYPDTGKFGVLSEDPDFPFRFVGRASSAADYWEGE